MYIVIAQNNKNVDVAKQYHLWAKAESYANQLLESPLYTHIGIVEFSKENTPVINNDWLKKHSNLKGLLQDRKIIIVNHLIPKHVTKP